MRSKPTITLTVGKARWKRVHSFAGSGPDDRHYVVRTIRDKMTIALGDGTHGAVPRAGATIEAGYRSGSGAPGNTVAVTVRATCGKTRDRAVRIAIRKRCKAISFSG